MFLNILVVLIGKCASTISRRNSFMRRSLGAFFTPFIVVSNDTFIRRVFAVSIPFTMTIMVLAAIASSFAVLFHDEKRIPIYELPTRTYTVINNPEYLSNISVRELFVPSALLPKAASQSANPAVSKGTPTSDRFDTPSENQVLYSSSTVTGSSSEPQQSTLGDSTLLLVQFLRDRNIDPSLESRVALASFLNIQNYTGDEISNSLLLATLQALTAPSPKLSQQARN